MGNIKENDIFMLSFLGKSRGYFLVYGRQNHKDKAFADKNSNCHVEKNLNYLMTKKACGFYL